ncbi:pyridoxal phosphate-dependent decarboxylase family protein [Kangiella sediminilitoris]|uniref:Pyridoxal-dependent decarboxylase n=1 Tax=Kangiella sediminilitoris TaxID=1144748 RepID=A0A1B3BAK0_9GAMM|nr:pyridoxal-dependent decarboxylase [Kangiella sediminilitoris]AOE49832.1 Pyridoxal-dependent decarboxylase [Kangiella sediminilitoris]
MNLEFLAPYFLGPYGENNDIFEKVLMELLRDHIYWRRNIHPEDLPSISTFASQEPEYQEAVAKMRAELHKLTASLKQSVPFFSPRYIGHMCSDLMMPGLIAQMVTTLYNPNNVSFEAATVTVDLELKVGKQFAQMFGFNTDEASVPCAWGHLTSGGTVANYESLWNFRAAKYYPIALAEAAKKLAIELPESKVLQSKLTEASVWKLTNLSIDKVLELKAETEDSIKAVDDQLLPSFLEYVEQERIETLGSAYFLTRHIGLKQPLVLVPSSAHYSWQKAMRVMGFGSDQLIKIPVHSNMRLDINALKTVLDSALSKNIPILSCVGVLGTTEFGTIDPTHEIIRLRNEYRAEGLEFYTHIDAAWGGYLASMFRQEDGTEVSHESIKEKFSYFPSEEVYQSIISIKEVDSVTIDPHKLGYLPFGAGGFISRNQEISQLLTQEAPYVFEDNDVTSHPASQQFEKLGQYILEGSKPGSMAAAAYVTHQVLPLNQNNFGRVIRQSIKTAEYFYDKLLELKERLKDRATLCLPYTPDTNLICIAINPLGNQSLANLNTFTKQVYNKLKISRDSSPRNQEFIGSSTHLLRKNVSDHHAKELCQMLGINADYYVKKVKDSSTDSDRIMLLRHTIMNPWLVSDNDGTDYVTKYCKYLEELITNNINNEFNTAMIRKAQAV